MKKSGRDRIDPERPEPEEVLAKIKREDTSGDKPGRLRVFLGAAPGVGKTFAMLEEGHRLREAGIDVVIGLVETHGRAETAAQIGDLELTPRRSIPYRGIVLQEMDLDAILARAPEIVLIDELAHTNVQGSRHHKRFEDVDEILSQGIDVISTVNIQHLQSVNDIIEDVTGVKVRETLPDSVLDRAEVELVDLPTSLLRERLKTGKIYGRDQAVRALENFFRESNLTALRELALRRTAEGVEASLEAFMRGGQTLGRLPTVERVLVWIDPRVGADTALRSGWRLARGLHADLLAVVVLDRTIEQLPDRQRHTLEDLLELAEDLGAIVSTVIDSDEIAGIVRFALEERITDLVLGHPHPATAIRKWLGSSTLDRLLERLPGVDLHVV